MISAAPTETKPRLLVLTDIGGDPDDQQSMIRLMLYSSEFDIEGLIATASGTPGELKEKVTKPHLIREIVEAYGRVRPNLLLHRVDYPPPEQLLARLKSGNPQRGLGAVGEEHDTEGSNWIIAVADRPDPRPLNLCLWGGQTDLAQALWRVRHDRSEAAVKHFLSKLRVHDIADQDGLQPWLFENFPDLFYVLDKAPAGRDKREAAFRGMYLGGDESLTSREWIETNVKNHHGPLGALYPLKTWTAPNKHGCLKEGDTPSWFFFLPNGLNAPEHPQWGGWGGRFSKAEAGLFREVPDTLDGRTEARLTVSRWRPAFQSDFAARMDWCVKPRTEANHAPEPRLAVAPDTLAPGAPVALDASQSTDPDGNTLSFRWWHYREPSTFEGEIELDAANTPTPRLRVVALTRPGTLHLILEVTDDGQPQLTAYRRLLFSVRPQ